MNNILSVLENFSLDNAVTLPSEWPKGRISIKPLGATFLVNIRSELRYLFLSR